MKIGYHKVTHIPDDSVFLSGYPRHEKTSAIHLAPEISCFTMDMNNRKLAFCTLDTILVTTDFVHQIRMKVAEQTDIAYEDIHVSATHTHSAPCIFKMNIPDPPVNEGWTQVTLDTCVKVIIKSTEKMIECDSYFAQTTISGVYGNRNDIHGIENKQAYILSFYRGEQLLGKWINLSCHNTINSTDNIISSDLFGGIRKQLVTDASFCVITNGISGDSSTRFYRQGTDCKEVNRLSTLMADQLMNVPRGNMINESIHTDLIGTHAYQNIRHNQNITQQIITLEKKKALNQFENWDDFTLESYYKRREIGTFYHFLESSIILLDTLIIVTIPGEAVAYFDQYLRAQFPNHPLLFMGTTDGYVGYLVPEDDQNDFEAEMAEVAVRDGWRHIHRIEGHVKAMISTYCGNTEHS